MKIRTVSKRPRGRGFSRSVWDYFTRTEGPLMMLQFVRKRDVHVYPMTKKPFYVFNFVPPDQLRWRKKNA